MTAKQKAFEILLEPHKASLLRACLHQMGDRDLSHDLYQETLYQAFRSFPRFRPGSDFWPWIYTIMRNKHRSYLIQQGRRPRIISQNQPGNEETGYDLLENVPSPGSETDNQVLAKIAEEDLQLALSYLPEDQKEVILLFHVEGLSLEEIAINLEVPVGTVESRLTRGRQTLRVLLGKPTSTRRPKRR